MQNKELLQSQVRNIMTTSVTTVKELDNADTVNNVLERLNVHHVPVVSEGGTLIGMISKTEIELLKHWGTNYGLRDAKKQNKRIFNSMLAKDIMKKNVVSVSPDNTLEYCAEIFSENVIHSLPVVENDVLVGILTTHDLISTAYQNT